GRKSAFVAALGDDIPDAPRHGDAEIGLDQHFFDLIERILVELALGERAREILRQRGRASRKSLAQLGEPAPPVLGCRLARWLRRLGRRPLSAGAEQPLHEGRLLRLAHDATTATSDVPSSPSTTASTRAPARCRASSVTGVKSAARPCASFSISTSIRRPFDLARCAFSAAIPLARSLAARSAMTGPGTCGISAAGVPSRAEKGKTCRKVSPQSSTSESEPSNMASVSVGKPAIRSAPNTTSGRRRRTSAQNA